MARLIRYRPNMDLFHWDRVIDRFFDDDPYLKSRTPVVDVSESDTEYTMEVELPGLTEKDIEVKVENNLLTISSKKEESKKEDRKGYLLHERRRFEFSRSFSLPKEVDREKIEAEFKNGLLKLVLAKTPKAQPKMIDVKAN
jgi:HSP20 family protein